MEIDLEAIRFIRRKFEAERTRYTEILIDGGPKTYDDYKEITGTIRGLALGDQILSDLENTLRKSQDE